MITRQKTVRMTQYHILGHFGVWKTHFRRFRKFCDFVHPLVPTGKIFHIWNIYSIYGIFFIWCCEIKIDLFKNTFDLNFFRRLLLIGSSSHDLKKEKKKINKRRRKCWNTKKVFYGASIFRNFMFFQNRFFGIKEYSDGSEKKYGVLSVLWEILHFFSKKFISLVVFELQLL